MKMLEQLMKQFLNAMKTRNTSTNLITIKIKTHIQAGITAQAEGRDPDAPNPMPQGFAFGK
jgi:hypothetical protein